MSASLASLLAANWAIQELSEMPVNAKTFRTSEWIHGQNHHRVYQQTCEVTPLSPQQANPSSRLTLVAPSSSPQLSSLLRSAFASLSTGRQAFEVDLHKRPASTPPRLSQTTKADGTLSNLLDTTLLLAAYGRGKNRSAEITTRKDSLTANFWPCPKAIFQTTTQAPANEKSQSNVKQVWSCNFRAFETTAT